ncbi:MAG: uracil-DNA glycosylase family protein [Actinomycetota bacterium]
MHESVRKCKKCTKLLKSRKQPVPGIGAPNAKIIIIGYYPTPQGAEKAGEPFCGDESGNFLRNIMDEVDLLLEKDTYLTYLIKCTPRVGDKLEPKEEFIKNCIHYFIEEISITTPHIIVSLGLKVSNIILKHFFSIEKNYEDINDIHMRVFENPSFKLVPFYSPHDVMVKKKVSEEKYTEDFRSLAKLLKIV